MLKQNTTILCQMPLRQIGGLFAGERVMFDQTERLNKFVSEAGWDPLCGVPSGHLPPSTWTMPRKSGGMSAFTTVQGQGTTTASLALGLAAQASLTGAGTVSSATAQLVVSLVASLSGSGTVSSADLRAFLNAVASLSGSGSVTAALGALAWADAALSGSGTVSSAVPYASGELAATIRGYSDLTPEGVRDKVWSAIASSFNEAGTMGQKLNSAASGGVDYGALGAAVWDVLSSTANDAGTMGALLNAAGTLDKQTEILTKLDTVAIASGAINASATGFTLTTGTVITGSYTDVRSLNGVYHQINDSGGVIDMEYTFDIGRDALPAALSASADLRSSNDALNVYAWHWANSAWEQIGTRQGDNNSRISVNEYTLLQAHVGTGANVGQVRIRFNGTGLTSAQFIIDQLVVTYAVVSRRIGYVGTVVSAAASTVTLSSDASDQDNFYFPALAVITSGTGRDQSRRVDAYVGATRTATVATPWTVVPDSTSTIELHPWGSVRVSDIDAPVLDAIEAVAGLTATESARLTLIEKLQRNKLITDPTTGLMTLYDDDGTTVLLQGQLYEDADGTQDYRGLGSSRRERLT